MGLFLFINSQVNKLTLVFIIFILLSHFTTNAQTKNIGECTIQYSIIQLNSKDTIGEKWVYVKGDQCKTILQHPQMRQTLLFNTQLPTAIIIKDIGASHFLQEVAYPPLGLSTLISMKELFKDSTLQILGYKCKNLELKWSDGTVYQIWYTTDIITTVNTFEIAFKEIDGLVLSYNIISLTGEVVQFMAKSIDFSPIPISLFNINKTQYQNIE
jgi:hypothetical protein